MKRTRKARRRRAVLTGLTILAAIVLSVLAGPICAWAQTPSNLTGTYISDDGGIYYMEQSGTVLWWAGMSLDPFVGRPDEVWHRGLGFSNVFRGTVAGDGTINGQWVEVSRGGSLNSGTLTLAVVTTDTGWVLSKTAATGRFPATVWEANGALDDTVFDGAPLDIVSRFNVVQKNNADNASLGDDNLKAYRDQTVLYGRLMASSWNGQFCGFVINDVVSCPPDFGVSNQVPAIEYGPNTAIPNYYDFSQLNRDFNSFACYSERDGDIDTNLKVDLDKLESDFYTTGWGNRSTGPTVYAIKFNSADAHQKLNLAANEAFTHIEAIMYGKAGTCSSPPEFGPYGNGSLLPGWADLFSASVLVNGRPINGQVFGDNCNFVQPCPYLNGADSSDYATSAAGIRFKNLLLGASGDGKIESFDGCLESDGCVRPGVGTYVRVTGALVLDCGHFSLSLTNFGHTCSDDTDVPGQTGDNQNQEIHPIYSIDVINYPFRPEDSIVAARPNLTGAWGGSDGSTYYIRQIANTIWWLGLPRDRQPMQPGGDADAYPPVQSLQLAAALSAGTAPVDFDANCGPGNAIFGVLLGAPYPCWAFANVYTGTITQQQDGSAIIQGNWAGVPQSTGPGNAGTSQTFTVDAMRKTIQPVSSLRTIFPATLQKMYEPEDTAPPTSALNTSGPQYLAFVSSATNFTDTATDEDSGVQNLWYRSYPDGTPPPAYTPVIGSTTSFTLAGADGIYDVGLYATDNAGNDEPAHLYHLYLDNTPPQITISQPAATQYPHSGTLTLAYTVTDQASGVQSFAPQMDGAATLSDGTGLASGQSINLLTELPLGTHTFSVNGVDNVGNAGSQSVSFSIVVTPDSIKGDVQQFLQTGAIKSSGLANSFLAKLNSAAAAGARGDCSSAADIYGAFINEVLAQSGKGVTAAPAAIMIADAQYLIARCP